LTTSQLWSRANFVNYLIWQDNANSTLNDIVAMTVPNAIQRGFDVFGIDSPSAHTRAKLEAWLTTQRADTHAWTNYQFLNLTRLLMLSPEFNLA
jgi:hypothetical protein